MAAWEAGRVRAKRRRWRRGKRVGARGVECAKGGECTRSAQLQNQYHDGAAQRSQLAHTSRLTFTFWLSKRLSASLLSARCSFWVSQNAGPTPFVLHNPFDVASGQQIGGNYVPNRPNRRHRHRA